MADSTSPPLVTTLLALDGLEATDPAALMAALLLALDPGFPVTERAARVLRELGLVNSDGRMHELTREAVLAWQLKEASGD